MSRLAFALAALLLASLGAQEFVGARDFLTDYEVDVLRERQAFKDRIEAYTKFAALRLELLHQSMDEDEAGRGAKVHRTLQEYGSIIQAIDDVIDDALLRNRKMDGALADLLAAERGFATRLAAIAAEPEADAWRYEFVLEDAIGITHDSIELLEEDLGERKREVARQDEVEKQRQRERMAPERRREARRDEAAQQEEATEYERKRPSLLRPGEKLGDR